jgi:hypothetical protein
LMASLLTTRPRSTPWCMPLSSSMWALCSWLTTRCFRKRSMRNWLRWAGKTRSSYSKCQSHREFSRADRVQKRRRDCCSLSTQITSEEDTTKCLRITSKEGLSWVSTRPRRGMNLTLSQSIYH